jgi:arylsulfatase A-like enzyme
LSRRYGYDRGFEEFGDLEPGERDPALRRLRGGQILLQKPWLHVLAGTFGKNLRPASLYVSAQEINARALALVEQADRPFFGWLHYMDVHWPYHRTQDLDRPREIAQAWQDVVHLHRVNLKDAPVTDAQKARYLDLYEKAVAYMDDAVRDLAESLQAAGVAGDTILVIVSDHGEEFLERGRWGHFETNLHDEIVRVPLIVKIPGNNGGAVVAEQVSTLDIMPTILDLAGCPPLDGLEGRSLQPLWKPQAGTYTVEPAISEMWRGEWRIVSIRTTDHKFIWDSRFPDRPALYDLARDPEECNDVAAEFQGLIKDFEQLLDRHLARGAATEPAETAGAPSMDEEMVRRLRDLGYLD